MAKTYTNDELLSLRDYRYDLYAAWDRKDAWPLDQSTLFASKSDAELYATGGSDARGISSTAYVGQIIAAMEDGIPVPYIIGESGLIKICASSTTDLSTLQTQIDNIVKYSDTYEGDKYVTFQQVAEKLKSFKDAVVESGTVKKLTEAEVLAGKGNATDPYIVLTLANVNPGTSGFDDKLYIDVKDLVDQYIGAENEITISSTNEIGIADAIKTSISNAASAAEAAQTSADNAQSTANAAQTKAEAAGNKADANETSINNLTTFVGSEASGETPASGLVARISTLETTVGDATTADTLVYDVADLKTKINNLKHPVESVDTTASNGVSLTLDSDKKLGVSVAVTDLKTALDYKTDEIDLSAHIGAYTESITADQYNDLTDEEKANYTYNASTGKYDKNTQSYRYDEGASLQATLSDIDARIAANTASISAAVAGGVTAISAGKGINVDSSISTQPKVSVKLDPNSNLAFTDDTDSASITLVWMED